MGTGVGEAALLQAMGVGAVTGAATSAVTGGDPLKGALFGAAGGALMPGVGQALGGAPTAAAAEGAALSSATAANTAATAAQQGILEAGGSQVAADNAFRQTFMDKVVPVDAIKTAPQTGFMDIFKPGIPTGDSAQRNFGQRLGDYIVQNPTTAAAIGGGAPAFFLNRPEGLDEDEKYKGPLSMFKYDPRYYRPAYASGGIADLPASKKYAGGGDLGGYSDGGRMLKGPGDGMSDSIPARIGRRQPARLADGEFVVPADVVSHLGNGSTDAGAKQLYSMMDKVRRARTGTKKQGKEINPRKYMPA